MIDKVITVSACVFLLGVMSFALSIVNLQFKFMSFLGDYKSIFDYTAMGLGLVVCVVASQIKKKKRILTHNQAAFTVLKLRTGMFMHNLNFPVLTS